MFARSATSFAEGNTVYAKHNTVCDLSQLHFVSVSRTTMFSLSLEMMFATKVAKRCYVLRTQTQNLWFWDGYSPFLNHGGAVDVIKPKKG